MEQMAMPNLFNSYLKRTPNSEIVKNVLILMTMVFAINIIYQNIIYPLINSDSEHWQTSSDVPYGIMDEVNNQGLESRQRSMKFVDTSQLFWNENPKRDPFSRHILNEEYRSKKNPKQIEVRSSDSQSAISVKPKLTGIIKGTDSNLAILDGKIMQVGDSIRGFYLKSIQNQSVSLVNQARLITIKINDGENNG